MWGSYIDCRETKYSFSFSKIEEEEKKILTCGPSDFDALLITNCELSPPCFNRQYHILDNKLNDTEKVNLNLMRDIFIIKTKELKEALLARESRYIDCYLYAYYKNGLVLKTNSIIDSIFNEFSKNRKYWISPKVNQDKKLNLLKTYLI